MTFNELIELCQPLDVYGEHPVDIGDLTQDSREVSEGSVFIAVRGTQVDGHMFIENAISRGASIIICEDAYYTEKADVCVLEVEDTRTLVGPLAQAFQGYPGKKLTLIGVTGTNGKTTVTSLIYQALKKLGARPSLLGTVGKRIEDELLDSLLTTSDPIELARDMRRMVAAKSSHLVMEVSSHALDQQRVAGLNFEIAGFTNLSHDHLDYHESLDEYAAAKKKLFDSLAPDATAVVNGDDPNAELMLKDCKAKKIRFSFSEKLDASCLFLASSSEGITIEINGVRFSSPLVGKFNAYNVALAFLICRELDYKEQQIAKALSQATGAEGRLERVQAQTDAKQPLVLVDYAHTPDALENVLSTLKNLKKKDQKLHVVFGCGGDRDKTKRPKMAAIAERFADQVTVTSDNPRSENPDAIIDDIMDGFADQKLARRVTDRKQAILKTIAEASDDTIILIAGKGHETYQEIGDKRYDFDDREIARQALTQKIGTQNSGEVA
ncbi:UDP-N-acetylmuramoyl-L-alanyl-D-glutamate--2,6-diaminopimelate ligase [Aliifodinibius sp. S!AR15-10]|uniref:UDP-N-acetylmuramoyl-L-alanyl-D-glutamate--2, 6-diaminopimelate ligase n=1 Tax=Aliifodinibius sp. S!AR15-10 TaxID=2950437 RepID=UPI00285A83B3|nr:UDP-N-acetylmuramoyl-L-alanyl-D-glutamate--2,6-diaminopimelate ligase [Aliifodinibius sp. S!AR15-10]MDR8393883.1 UDP-N-acetylmuramoyl-L-alanyl-D-glutamate--2,6-diaminopimelate ligase [Aliifodinibius sp. S!AR15-10]